MRCRLALLRDHSRFAEAFSPNRLGSLRLPEAFRLEFRIAIFLRFNKFLVKPFTDVLAGIRIERADYFPIIARNKAPNLLLPLNDYCKRRRLHASDRSFEKATRLGIERSHGASAIDSDQPIGFRAAQRGIGQRQHFLIVSQTRKAVANRRWRHRLQPQPFDRLFGFGEARDVAENQFALPPRVASIDQRIDVFALNQSCEHLQARLGSLDRRQVEMRRNHRQICKRPFAFGGFDPGRHGQFQQMADR